MKRRTHSKCFFFRSNSPDGFYVQTLQCGDNNYANFVFYKNCYFYGGANGSIKKIVDHVNGVVYIANPECPYFQE